MDVAASDAASRGPSSRYQVPGIEYAVTTNKAVPFLMLPTAESVRDAARRLHGVILATPLRRSDDLSNELGVDVFLKHEEQQRTGSFKLRGAYNALATLTDDARRRGVVASSAGNHGLGVAHAARALGIRAMIFVPSTAPAVKRDGILALGADVNASSPHYDAAHHAAEAFARDNERTFVNPCAGEPLLAGQGTVALEILDALPALRTVLIPVGGGGLVGGMAGYLRTMSPAVRIVGAQSDQTDAMARSLAAGHRVEVDVPPTLADGLAGQIDDVGYAIGAAALDTIVTVSEAQIADTIAWLASAHGTRVEGSGAVAVAALRHRRVASLGGPVAVVIRGGNIDEKTWNEIVRTALTVH